MKAAVILATTVAGFMSGANGHARGCEKLFTVKMGERAGRAVYAGTRRVSRRNLRLLGYIERCQTKPSHQRKVRAFDHSLARAHRDRVEAKNVATWPQGDTSWYNDAGTTACGFHAYYGVANKSLPCGTHVTFSYGARLVTAEVDDRGPYSGDRIWDLNQNTAGALGFSGVGWVHYRVG